MHLLHSPYENPKIARASPHREAIFNGLAVVTVRVLKSYVFIKIGVSLLDTTTNI